MIAAAGPLTTADRLLANQISTQLAETHRANLRRLSVDVSAGEVTLRGNVSTFHEKQIAIQTCRVLPGISRLARVLPEPPQLLARHAGGDRRHPPPGLAGLGRCPHAKGDRAG